MSKNHFVIDTEGVKSVSTKVKNAQGQFKQEYMKLYTAVEALKTDWDGKAQDTFNKKILEYKNDFEDMEKLIGDFGAFLEEVSDKYRQAEEELEAAAQKLYTGR